MTDSPNIETIDLTPRGCTTPEGQARVNAAMKAFEESGATVANAAMQFFDNWRELLMEAHRSEPEFIEEMRELDELVKNRRDKQEEFMRSVAGVPATFEFNFGTKESLMPAAKQVSTKPPSDKLSNLADRLRDYSTSIDLIEWLVDNHQLPPATVPADLAYDFAIRFSRHRQELDKIIGS